MIDGRILEEPSGHLSEWILIGLSIMLIIFIFVGVCLEHNHVRTTCLSPKIKVTHESVVILVFAIAFTLIFKKATGHQITESIESEIIFTYLLPPIILAAGFNMRKKFFFKNVGFIAIFGFLGTVINFFLYTAVLMGVNKTIHSIVGEEESVYDWNIITVMKIAATMVASDSIAPLTLIDEEASPALFSIIFGEGITNDAVALILTNTILQLDSEGTTTLTGKAIMDFTTGFLKSSVLSILFGFGFGCLSCIIHKVYKPLTHFPILETSLIFLMAILTYSVAELPQVGLAAIVSIFIFGIVQSHYNRYNLSKESIEKAGFVFGLVSYICEAFILIYMGLSFDSFKIKPTLVYYAVSDFFGLFLTRAMMIYFCTFLSRLCTKKKSNMLSYRESTLVMFGGMIRGAIAYAMMVKMANGNETQLKHLVPLCQLLVVLTIMIFTPLNQFLFTCLIKGGNSQAEGTNSIRESFSHVQDQPRSRSVLFQDRGTLIKKKDLKCSLIVKRLDELIFKPLLIRNYETRAEEIRKKKKMADIDGTDAAEWRRNTFIRNRISVTPGSQLNSGQSVSRFSSHKASTKDEDNILQTQGATENQLTNKGNDFWRNSAMPLVDTIMEDSEKNERGTEVVDVNQADDQN